ncbi:MAG TPA: GTP cyclohydrolase I FolE [Lachnoclostridium sp.]|nr:GTP cyclohydrolase I FolE [Lachnoclostridium sp.]
MIDEKAIEEHIRGILVALGDDPEREGLKDTPKRVAKMCSEVFAGMNYTNHEIAEMFNKTFEDGADAVVAENPGRVVVVKDIDIFSYCEHHMALMYDMKVSVAYIPRGRVIGLSKIARVCDMVGKRLQLQERIGEDIADIITEITGSEDVAVTIVGCHSCMSARGIRKEQAKTFTTELRGQFRENPNLMFYLK